MSSRPFPISFFPHLKSGMEKMQSKFSCEDWWNFLESIFGQYSKWRLVEGV